MSVPQPELSFFRLGYFNNFSHASAPSGHTSMYVELAYSPRKPARREEAVARIRRDLGRIGIRSSAICSEDINDIEYAYPIFDTAYALSRRTLIDFFSGMGVIPCGRYGAWRYMSMEDVIMDGKRAAEEVCA
jgi:protoporphyrinogen oxidase